MIQFKTNLEANFFDLGTFNRMVLPFWRIFSLIISFLFCSLVGISQNLPANFPLLEEYARRAQLNDTSIMRSSFQLRPIQLSNSAGSIDSLFYRTISFENLNLGVLPILSISELNSDRPFGWGNFGMIPNKGIQQYLSGGVFGNWKIIEFQLQPEFIFAQNLPYYGFPADFNQAIINDRFFYWNNGDYPERFGNSSYTRIWWGQSKIMAKFGAFEGGISTQNIWWGPGQWNALTFSNNAQGFPHLTIRTGKPAKTFLGNFETQLLSGRIEDSGLSPSQHPALNEKYFSDFSGDWKYVNALSISYNPKWVKGLFLGFNRTFQVYREKMGDSFLSYFPVFSGITKEQFFEDGNSVEFDSDGADQQISVTFRWVVPASHFEFYGEFGRRDHALNWREFILNPEHARAYMMGFMKLFPLNKPSRFLQVRGEMTHQQESVNRYVRYPGTRGGLTWHTHNPSRAFANFGQALGVGIGVGSNVQIIEFSMVEEMNKLGLIFQRLENQQDFYYRAFGQQTERKPWIDLSVGLVFDHRWDNLVLGSKILAVNGLNYQWQLAANGTPEFPKGRNLFSAHAQVNVIYFLKTKADK
ncbi:capsule assembly Wzi family protein [Mariniradius sediminis]|nr:capsule assembly Wzi family protein [Mariniradius sediminis]